MPCVYESALSARNKLQMSGCCGPVIVSSSSEIAKESVLITEDAQTLSVVVPILNEIKALPHLLEHCRHIGAEQIVFVDGGSGDGSLQWMQNNVNNENEIIVLSQAGRAIQMNAGAKYCQGDMLVFLHADTVLPENAKKEILFARNSLRLWGRFDVRFPSDCKNPLMMRVIASFINFRSRLSSIATGDQALFVDRELFRVVSGFPDLPIMEDIAMTKQLKQHCVPLCSALKVTTSARRWEQGGVIKTVLLMWGLRLAFALGASADRLANVYQQAR